MNVLHVEPNVIVDFKEMAAAQKDPELVRLKLSPSSLILRDIPLLMMSDSMIVFDFSTNVTHPYIPPIKLLYMYIGTLCLTQFTHSRLLVYGHHTISGHSTIHVAKHKFQHQKVGMIMLTVTLSLHFPPSLQLMLSSIISIWM